MPCCALVVPAPSASHITHVQLLAMECIYMMIDAGRRIPAMLFFVIMYLLPLFTCCCRVSPLPSPYLVTIAITALRC